MTPYHGQSAPHPCQAIAPQEHLFFETLALGWLLTCRTRRPVQPTRVLLHRNAAISDRWSASCTSFPAPMCACVYCGADVARPNLLVSLRTQTTASEDRMPDASD